LPPFCAVAIRPGTAVALYLIEQTLKRQFNRRLHYHHFRRTEMLTIHDLSKEVDMSAVRGGWGGCGDEDSERRHHDRDGCRDRDRDDRDRDGCEHYERRFDSSAPVGSFVNLNLGLKGGYGQQ
jgi:hypothetical protein